MKKWDFAGHFFGDFAEMSRIFRPSFLEKIGIVQTYLRSIFGYYLTYISVDLLDSMFLAQISLSPNCPKEHNGTEKICGTIVGTGTIVCTLSRNKMEVL